MYTYIYTYTYKFGKYLSVLVLRARTLGPRARRSFPREQYARTGKRDREQKSYNFYSIIWSVVDDCHMYYAPTLVLCATSLTLRPPPLGLSSAPRFFRARLQPYTHLRVISKSPRYSRHPASRSLERYLAIIRTRNCFRFRDVATRNHLWHWS